jgi:hypothetical protein
MNGDGIWLEGANEEDICELPDVSDDALEAAGMDRKLPVASRATTPTMYMMCCY